MTRTHSPYAPRATEARFVRAPEGHRGHTHVQISGEHLVARGTPLLARLGAQPLVGLVIRADGQGMSGIALHAPRDGDRLYLGYASAALAATDIVYRTPGRSPAAPRPVA